MESDKYPMPAYRHLPGQNERPNDGMLESIASKVLTAATIDEAVNQGIWAYSIRLINERYYWEAHEVLEALWNCATPNSRERSLFQCLIQLSNARLKAVLGQTKATLRLKQLTTECFLRAYGHCTEPLMGIKPEELAAAIEACDSDNAFPLLTFAKQS